MRFTLALICSAMLVLPSAAEAKKAKQPKAGQITGVRCYQGSHSVHISASELKPSLRKRLRKGDKTRFNYPEVGPVNCVVY